MKKHIHGRGPKISILLVSAALIVSSLPAAWAEPLKPAGPYEEARLGKTAVTANASISHQSAAPSVAIKAPATKAQPASLVGEMKKWARTQWRAIKTLWNGEPAKVMQIAEKRKPANENLEDIKGQSGKTAALIPVAASLPKPPANGAPESVPPTSGAVSESPQVPSTTSQAPVANLPPSAVKLQAPSAAPARDRGPVEQPGVQRTATGVASYDLSASTVIPKLNIEKEERLNKDFFGLDSRMQKIMNDRVVRALESPELLNEKVLKELLKMRVARAGEVENVKDFKLAIKGKISTAAVDRIVLKLRPELELKLAKVVPLTPEEVRFLSGLLLYQKGDQCPTAIGVFYKLTKSKGWEAEANYYLAMCSKQLALVTDFYERAAHVLDTQDVFYAKKILSEIDSDVPYEVQDRFGSALLKAAGNAKIVDGLAPEVNANVAYVLADYSVSSERFKTALTWAPKVPATHPKYLKAQFLQALAEYQAGSKEKALAIQDKIVNDPKTDKSKMEFQALVALNAARMHFQEQNFKSADENFHKVYKDHPLWLQSLTELGWAQLMSGDFEGAIGNMYSIHSPFFTSVYKPESFVIRTIGYINLCQYGDAYRTLSILERDYRPQLDRMVKYLEKAKGKPAHYQTVRSFLAAAKGAKEVDGLPMPVIREMARHRDFINMQKALNREIDERPNYNKMNNEVEGHLKAAQNSVNDSRRKLDLLRKKIAQTVARKNAKEAEKELRAELETGLSKLNDQFFFVDLYTEAKVGVDEYRREVVGAADQRIAGMRERIEKVLGNRLLRMKVELARMLDNNELLRYEVFAGSGENIRYQVAGGETGKRIPASVLPKSKSLQWEFDGEYWEDEIGHYRSGLKNNCPEKQQAHASLEGGAK